MIRLKEWMHNKPNTLNFRERWDITLIGDKYEKKGNDTKYLVDPHSLFNKFFTS